ncbi:protein S100-A2-like [Callorhinchus milii]|uniref:Protein S100-A6-like n=1 Tax=Callorhinchus milii TaxID=7868 RepID=A0A4W3H9U2_CALMI|nr:protein S100-A2-like [Callorhinchus milii]|eukprot:gi/632962041/ref/XP_007897091.1/ PREDICTED: protein S100-A6-like [Callorhinchus milii]
MSFAEHSELQKLMKGIVDIFRNYAGCKNTLTNSEAKELLEKELFANVQAPDHLEKMKSHMKILDTNQDGIITFVEFINLLTVLMVLKSSKLQGCPIPTKQKCK